MLTGYLITLGNDCSFLGVTIVCDYVFLRKSHSLNYILEYLQMESRVIYWLQNNLVTVAVGGGSVVETRSAPQSIIFEAG